MPYGDFAGEIALDAHKALICEVLTTPKPGLVDRFNNGAHRDMDVFTFVNSAEALLPYFLACAEAGVSRETSPDMLLSRLRPLGTDAEKAMFKATGGVNTHKGAIFSMGIMCAAAAFCGEEASPEEICLAAGRIAGPVRKDFSERDRFDGTFGMKLYSQSGISGIRGEAAAGFPSLRNTALPAMRRELGRGRSLNDAAALTLAELILEVEDTTFIKRCAGREPEQYLALVSSALEDAEPLDALSAADAAWSAAGVSAGGCADLLSLTLFLYFFRTGNGREL